MTHNIVVYAILKYYLIFFLNTYNENHCHCTDILHLINNALQLLLRIATSRYT